MLLRANTPLPDTPPDTTLDNDSEDEEFVYPGTSTESEPEHTHPLASTSEEAHDTIP